MIGQRGGEEGKGLEARAQVRRLREGVTREELDEEAGGAEQIADAAGGAISDVAELLVAGGQQEAGGGDIPIADDGETGGGDQGDEQRRDVHAEPEGPVSRGGGLGAIPGSVESGRTGSLPDISADLPAGCRRRQGGGGTVSGPAETGRATASRP